MAKRRKHEDHENLERWMVSYADFMTLLFATFVVLYALSQVDIGEFTKLEEALKKAFQANVFDGQESILDSSGSIMDGYDGATNPIMLEYLSPKYEEDSYQEILNELNSLKMDGVKAQIDERGLVIKLSDKALMFDSGSAEIPKESLAALDAVAKLIKEKFSIHIIRVEGHTDSVPVSNDKYPSNWELSSARASSVVRYLVSNYGFSPSIFIAAGYADTAPASKGNSAKDRQLNRRVELIVLKNNLKGTSSKVVTPSSVKNTPQTIISPAAQELVGDDEDLMKNVIDFKNEYNNETKRIEVIKSQDETTTQHKPDFLE